LAFGATDSSPDFMVRQAENVGATGKTFAGWRSGR
jgi:hypothetical protein